VKFLRIFRKVIIVGGSGKEKWLVAQAFQPVPLQGADCALIQY
jgi:hypothetical protein